MTGLVELLRGPIAHVALLFIGLAVLVAELWLLTIGTPVLLVVVLLAMTGFTEYVLGQSLWEDYR